jgi:hypothetical protein
MDKAARLPGPQVYAGESFPDERAECCVNNRV